MNNNKFFKVCNEIVPNLLEILELSELTFKEKELISAYSFGIISEVAKEFSVSEELISQAVKNILINQMEYTIEDTNKLFDKLLKSIKESCDEGLHIMYYQGAYSYDNYKNKKYNEIYNNLTNMIDIIQSGEYKSY